MRLKIAKEKLPYRQLGESEYWQGAQVEIVPGKLVAITVNIFSTKVNL
jgi:hypothetical protein